ncbi:MAG: hypothetical protein K9G64_03370 [Bacteroidia bacterium]|nr:hypothetical protein [Bacteroidia bacterium]
MKKVIKYISYGKYETGGYKHELFFAEQLHQFLNNKGENVSLEIVRKNRFYTNPLAYLKLFLLGLKANANFNILVARVALFAVLRNAFTQNKVYIVLHYFDSNDGKSFWLNLYYEALFFLLKNTKNKNISIVTVAPFWVQYFKEKIKNNIPVFHLPNFFDGKYYEKFIQKNSQFELKNSQFERSREQSNSVSTPLDMTVNPHYIKNRKKKQIHLGQWSFKNHPDVFEIAKQLTDQGYYCYFSTNFKDFATKTSTYEVVYFDQFENYLTQMAFSEFTLALTRINEGWNRVAHESILVGTPVIAYAKAGLLNLTNESKSIAANNMEEVLEAIENKNVQANPSLLAHYDIKNVADYLNKMFI